MLFVSFFLIIFLIFFITSAGENPYNYFTRLADAFLHGRLYLTNQPSWLSELVPMSSTVFYVVQPPLPALLSLPFVAVFGAGFQQQILAHLIGAGITVVTMAIAKSIFNTRNAMVFGGILGGFGTIMWYEAATGSVWYLGQITCAFFLLLGILESLTQKRPHIMGAFLGAAYLSRIHTILAAPFFLYILYQSFSREKIFSLVKGGQWAPVLPPFILFVLGALPFLLFNALYNYARWGSPLDKGYFLIPGIYDEPWFSKGMLNIEYIPDHLSLLFLKLPKIFSHAPYIMPSWFGLAIWITTPVFIATLFAPIKKRLVQVSWFVSFLIFLVVALRGGTGWTQFGYRYAVDFYPFLLLLTFLGIKRTGFKKIYWILLLIGVTVNLWGVIWINKFGWVEF